MEIFGTGQIGTGRLADGAVTNAKVSATAAIASSKLDLSAVAQVITPDADNTRDIGTVAKQVRTLYVGTSVIVNGIELLKLGQQALLR